MTIYDVNYTEHPMYVPCCTPVWTCVYQIVGGCILIHERTPLQRFKDAFQYMHGMRSCVVGHVRRKVVEW